MNVNFYPGFGLQGDSLLSVAWRDATGYSLKHQEDVRVMVITQNTLLGDLLEILLAGASIFPVQRVWQTHPDCVLQRIDQYRPTILVLEEGLIDEDCLLLLSGWQMVRGRRRIILVHPQKNLVRVYPGFKVALTQSADFIDLIKNDVRYNPYC